MQDKDVLVIDIETYSDIDIEKCGLFKYMESPQFDILLFGYKLNDEPTECIDLTVKPLSEKIISKILDSNTIKVAHNSFFEMTAIDTYFKRKSIRGEIKPQEWQDTMIMALTLGLPAALAKVGEVMQLDLQKDTQGKALIKYFSMPCEPTKANCNRTRNLPEHAPDRWELYKSYNIRDVDSEAELFYKLQNLPNAQYDRMWEEWCIDYKINKRGVKIDTNFATNAALFGTKYSNFLNNEIIKITGIDNPKSNNQLKKWILDRTGVEIESLTKSTDLSYIQDAVVQHVFKLRNELQKTSLTKYQTMIDAACNDGKARGLLQFYGASTGRWAGRLIQVQNLPKNKMEDLDIARQAVARGDYDMFEMLYPKQNDALSELIRTAFIPSKDKFIVADYNAIEARVIAWLAGEKWAMDVFANGQDIYKATASQMFHIPVEEIGKDLRSKGKIATLALGYQGGVGAMTAMGALKMGISEEELPDIVKRWRKANPHIVALWNDIQECTTAAIENVGLTYSLPSNKNVKFKKQKGILFIYLPSGRMLKYIDAKVKDGRIVYKGMRQNKDASIKQWCEVYTFGGKLCENIVQAIARDCLMESIIKLEKQNYEINFHVHDEVIIDSFEFDSVDEVTRIMGEEIPWAKGLILKACGYECKYYMKD